MIRHVLGVLALTAPVLAQEPHPVLQPDRSVGLALWEKIHAVFSHPRCANCHVGPDNVPMWAGPRPHGMNINGGTSRDGAEYIPCGACHTPHNAQVSHGPPGAEGWALAPLTMQWFGKPSADICAQVKDLDRNGGRTISTGELSLTSHIAHEPLVQWGWAPGPGREPAPYSAAQVVQFLKEWEAAGAPCP
jgi:hypothetical protein